MADLAGEIWAQTEADLAARPPITEWEPVVVHDPDGALSGLDELGASIPGPQRDGGLDSETRLHVKAVRGPALRAIRWYTEPYQERTDRFHHLLYEVLARLANGQRRHREGVTRLAQDVRRLADENDDLRRWLRRAEARLAALEAGSGAGTGAPAADSGGEAGPAFFDYRAFEDRHRGSYAEVRDWLRPYVELFEAPGPVLDVGCGRGEFLELLSEAGMEAYGVDLDPGMVEAAAERGLDARLGDAIAHLRGLPGATLGGVFSSQFAEHVTPAQLTAFCEASARALAPGGVFVAETPNPESLYIFASFFYVDLSHTNPVHPDAFTFLLETAGFGEITVRRSMPVPAPLRLEMPEGDSPEARNTQRLNDLLYGPQHYAVVGRRS